MRERSAGKRVSLIASAALMATAIACAGDQVTPRAPAAPASSAPPRAPSRQVASPPGAHASPQRAPASSTISPCAQAEALILRARVLFAEGKLWRTLRVLEAAERACSDQKSLALHVRALAEIGRYEEALALAARIRATPGAPEDALGAATTAERICAAERDVDYTDAVYRAMNRPFQEGKRRFAEGDFEAAQRLFMQAWEINHPNGNALAGAANAAKKRGFFAEAQALYDRAIVDSERKEAQLFRDEKPRGAAASKAGADDTSSPTARTVTLTLDLPNSDEWEKIRTAAWSPDGRLLAVGTDKQTVIFETLRWRAKPPIDKVADHIAFAPALLESARARHVDSTIAIDGSDGTLTVWDLPVGSHRSPMTSDSDGDLAFTRDGKTLFEWKVGVLRRIDVATGVRKPDELVSNKNGFDVKRVVLDRRGAHALVCINDPKSKDLLFIYDFETKSLIEVADGCGQFAFNDDGTKFVQVVDEREPVVWDTATRRPAKTDPSGGGDAKSAEARSGEKSPARGTSVNEACRHGKAEAVGLLQEGKSVVLRVLEKEIALCFDDARAPILLPSKPAGMSLHSTGGLAVWGEDTITIWDLKTRARVVLRGSNVLETSETTERAEGSVRGECGVSIASGYKDIGLALRLTPDDRLLRLRRSIDALIVEDLTAPGERERVVVSTPWRGAETSAGALSARGAHFAVVAASGVLSGGHGPVLQLPDARDDVWPGAIALSPSGDVLATLARSRKIALTDAATGTELRRFTIGNDVTAMGFDHTGQALFVATWAPFAESDTDRPKMGPSILRIDVRTGTITPGFSIQRAKGAKNCSVTAIAVAPDGATVALGSGPKVEIRDAKSGVVRRTLGDDRDMVRTIAFSSHVVAAGYLDGMVRVWGARDGDPLAAVRTILEQGNRVTGYTFTPESLVDFFGDARSSTICRIGNFTLPFEVCEERFFFPGLLGRATRDDRSFRAP